MQGSKTRVKEPNWNTTILEVYIKEEGEDKEKEEERRDKERREERVGGGDKGD